MNAATIFVVAIILGTFAVAQPTMQGDLCNAYPDNCPAPLSCVGAGPGRMPRCYQKKAAGMTCDVDPFWVCEDGLECFNNVCSIPIEATKKCEAPNAACRPPLSCVGVDRKKRCYMKKAAGMSCGVDPFWVCQDGLECNSNVCGPPAGAHQRCDRHHGGCIAPLSCVGPVRKMRCYMRKAVGMTCGVDPFWVCEEGLNCIANTCTA